VMPTPGITVAWNLRLNDLTAAHQEKDRDDYSTN
jgi:hypothetical protein